MALAFVVLALAGCAAPSATAEVFTPRVDQSHLADDQPQVVGELSRGVTLRQTFWATHNGLTGVTIPFVTNEAGTEGDLTFTLRDDAGKPIFQEQFGAAGLMSDSTRRFRFAALPDSSQRAYTVELSSDGPAGRSASAEQDEEDRYPGELSLDGEVVPGDLLIEWSYKSSPEVLAFHAVRGLAEFGPTLLVALLLWTLPGLAMLAWLRQGDAAVWSLQRLWATALALSGTLLVIVPQFTHLVGLRLGGWVVWALLAASIVALLVARRRRLSFGPLLRPDAATVLFFGLVGIVTASRFLALHPLGSPLWGDSLHHTLITQLLLDKGGIFENYLPYVPLGSFTYHGGFHLLNAWMSWSSVGSRLSAMDAVLLNGQWLNVLCVVMVGLLAECLARRRGRPGVGAWAGVLALLFAGLLGPMPAFYLNWGRYTQLAGQVFLPAALLWMLEGWEPARGQERRLVPVILVLAAIALTHYRIMMMLAIALPLLFAVLLWQAQGAWRERILLLLRRLFITGLAVGVLILPWYWTIAEGLLVRILVTTVTSAGQPPGSVAEYNELGDANLYVPRWMQLAAAAAVVWLSSRRKVAGILLAGWVAGMFVLSNPYTLFRLPGTGLVNNFMVQIALYIPVAALTAIGFADFVAWLTQRTRAPVRRVAWVAVLVILAFAVQGAWQQVDLAEVRERTMLTPLDERAAAWIAENTPPDAIFHINGFPAPAYGGSVMVGADGGWWLWLSARRETTVPPAIYGHESGIDPAYRVETNERFLRLREMEDDPEALADTMQAEGIDYLYIGAQDGRVGLPPSETALDAEMLANSADFETVYTDGFVWVFRVRDEG